MCNYAFLKHQTITVYFRLLKKCLFFYYFFSSLPCISLSTCSPSQTLLHLCTWKRVLLQAFLVRFAIHHYHRHTPDIPAPHAGEGPLCSRTKHTYTGKLFYLVCSQSLHVFLITWMTFLYHFFSFFSLYFFYFLALLSIYPSTCLSTSLSTLIFFLPQIYLPTTLPPHLPMCLSVYFSIHLPTHS